MNFSEYNRDQKDAIMIARRFLSDLSLESLEDLKKRINTYLKFRSKVTLFQEQYFSETCTEQCFQCQP